MHHPSLPQRARTTRRLAVPTVVTSGLVVGALIAVTLATTSATASAVAGEFTIGTTAVPLNQPTDPGIGTIAPAADAAENGMFGAQQSWPIVPLHASVARNGQLVTWGTPINSDTQGGFVYDVWKPAAGFAAASHTDYASGHDYDSFCNAFTTLADGKLLMVGGNSSMTTMVFDPVTGAQTMGQNLKHQRWYGTSLRLTDGRILVMGGSDTYKSDSYLTPDVTSTVARTPEIGTGVTDDPWTDLTGATSDVAFGVVDNRWWYPRAYNGPLGTVVGTSANQVWSLSTAGGGSVQQVGTLPWNPGVSGSQVMYAPGKELVAGGGQLTNDDDNAARANAAVIDWSTATPTITSVAAMPSAANWLNLTVLPTGEVLANGGTKIGNIGHDWTNAVRQAAIWNPTTRTWRTAATAQRTRSYHSTSVLLPSGAVFTGGGGIPGPETNFNAELYYPASLFTKAANGTVTWASRPAITAISGSATYGGTVDLAMSDSRTIAGASLISLPSVTHSQNTDQRRIPLNVRQQGGTVSATLPSSMDTMPAGDYELTVTDAKGVPSAAQIITIRRSGAGLVTVAPGTGPTTPPSTTTPTPAPTTSAPTPTPAPTTTAPTPAPSTTAPSPSASPSASPSMDPMPGMGPMPGMDPMPSSPPSIAPVPSGGTAPTPVESAPPASGSSGGGTGGGSAPAPSPSPSVPTPSTALKLPTGTAISIAPMSRTTARVSHAGTRIVIAKASTRSSKTVRAAASWIVRTGAGSKKGYSFESVDKRGYFLAAPASGTGAMTLLKKSSSASFAKRTTFSSVVGAMRHDMSFRLTASPTKVVRVSGSKVVIGTLSASDAARTAATFITAKGLAAKR